MAIPEESWELSARERDYTWPELLEYNIRFLKGETRGTWYHGGPLIPDQAPDDLIAITERGMFTTCGQGAEVREGYEQRAYLDAYLPLSIAEQILRGASRDPEVVFELTLIRTGQQKYVSLEMAALWENGDSFSLTKSKVEGEEEWNYCTNWFNWTKGVDGAMYVMTGAEFTRWNQWVKDGLCYLMIADKEYRQEPKSLPERILGYLDANTGETAI